MHDSTSRFPVSTLAFRALLLTYPRRFRARFATQMQEDFGDMLRLRGRLVAWRRALGDLVRSVPRERLKALRRRAPHRGLHQNNRRDRWAVSVLQDIRYAVRGLTKAPGYASIAIVTLALGIGANTAIFTLVNGILLKPPPFRDPEGIVAVWQHHLQSDNAKNAISPATFRDFEQQNTVFDGLAAYYHSGTTVTGDEEIPEQIQIGRVLPGFFTVLGTEPVLGRTFRDEERQPGNHRVTILSGEYWARRFGADSSVRH